MLRNKAHPLSHRLNAKAFRRLYSSDGTHTMHSRQEKESVGLRKRASAAGRQVQLATFGLCMICGTLHAMNTSCVTEILSEKVETDRAKQTTQGTRAC